MWWANLEYYGSSSNHLLFFHLLLLLHLCLSSSHFRPLSPSFFIFILVFLFSYILHLSYQVRFIESPVSLCFNLHFWFHFLSSSAYPVFLYISLLSVCLFIYRCILWSFFFFPAVFPFILNFFYTRKYPQNRTENFDGR